MTFNAAEFTSLDRHQGRRFSASSSDREVCLSRRSFPRIRRWSRMRPWRVAHQSYAATLVVPKNSLKTLEVARFFHWGTSLLGSERLVHSWTAPSFGRLAARRNTRGVTLGSPRAQTA